MGSNPGFGEVPRGLNPKLSFSYIKSMFKERGEGMDATYFTYFGMTLRENKCKYSKVEHLLDVTSYDHTKAPVLEFW